MHKIPFSNSCDAKCKGQEGIFVEYPTQRSIVDLYIMYLNLIRPGRRQTKKILVRECIHRSGRDFQLCRSCIPPVFSFSVLDLPVLQVHRSTAIGLYEESVRCRILLLYWFEIRSSVKISTYRGPEPFVEKIDLTYCHSVRQSVGYGYFSASTEHITTRSLDGDLN